MALDAELVTPSVLPVSTKPDDIPADPEGTEPALATFPVGHTTRGRGLEPEFRRVPKVAECILDRFVRDSRSIIRDGDSIKATDFGDCSNVTGRLGLGPRNQAWEQAVRRVGGQLGGIERVPSRFSLFPAERSSNRPR